MVDSGFGGPQSRRQRRSVRRHSVERALSASALLPTVAFAALGTVTVLLVAQMGMSPLGAVVGPSAHDGGHAVTTPRMSVSIDVSRLHSLRSLSSRDATRVIGPETVAAVAPPPPQQATRVAMAARVESPDAAPESGSETTQPQRPHGKSRPVDDATQYAATTITRAVDLVQVEERTHVEAIRATKPVKTNEAPGLS